MRWRAAKALNVEMSSALLAAYQEADKAHSNTVTQISQLNREKTVLE
jgi:uridine phosphorylase